MNKNVIIGSMTALITPFKEGKLDEQTYAKLIKRQIANGISAVVPVGTTGESATLTHDEHRVCIEIAVDACKFAQAHGADGILSVAPYYNKPTQKGLYLHYKTIASSVDLPVLLYNVPGRTGCDIAADTIIKLFNDCENIYGVKEASGSIDKCVDLLAHEPRLSVLSGEDKNIVSLYVFIENIVKNFNSYSQERTARDIFKQKLVNFYDELYRLLTAVDSALAIDFFDVALHNQPFVLMEFLKSAINADNFYLIDSYLSDDGMLNLGLTEDGDFAQISREKLYLLASIFAQCNDEFPTLIYRDETAQILSLLYDEKVEIFEEFYEVSSRFIAEFTPYPQDVVGAARIVYSSLFFEYVKNYKSEEVAKNTIFYGAIGTGKTRRLRSLITEKKH